MQRSFTSQGHFGAIHLEHPGVAARCRVRPCNTMARKKTQLHQPLCIIFRQIDAVQDAAVAGDQRVLDDRDIREKARPLDQDVGRRAEESGRDGERVLDVGCGYGAVARSIARARPRKNQLTKHKQKKHLH